MKNRKILAGILVAVIILCAGVIWFFAEKGKEPTPIDNADAVYSNAVEAARAMQDVVMQVTEVQEISIGADIFSTQSDYTLSCVGLGTDALSVSKVETLEVGKHKSEITELFTNGTVYATVNGSTFSSQMDCDTYETRFAPVVLLDANLYTSITGVDTGDVYIINLEGADTPEAWIAVDDAVMTNASGTAYISHKGKLLKSEYCLEYEKGNIRYKQHVTTQLREKTPTVNAPSNPKEYTPITYLDGPRLLECASGYLTQMNNIVARSKDTTYFQAFGDRRVQEISVSISNTPSWSCQTETVVTLSNDSRRGQDIISKETNRYQDGIYTQQINEEAPVKDNSISESQMRTYCQNLLVSTIILPKDILQCVKEETDDVVQITYTANNEFAQQISQNACNALYQNSELLENLSQKNTIKEIIGYLELDPQTGLPTASGIYHSSTYSAEDLPYQFSFQADQTYQIINEKK